MPLFAEISHRGQGLIGTIRDWLEYQIKQILNSVTATKKVPHGENTLAYDSANTVVLCRWKHNAVVTLASNIVVDKPIQMTNRWSVKEKKITITQPMVVRDYNCHMRGVDRVDQDISYYRTSLRKKKWWFSLFTWLLDATVANSYYIFRQNHPDMSFLDFRPEIVLYSLQGSHPTPSRPGPSRNRSEIATRVTQDVRFDERGHFIVVSNHQRKFGNCSARPVTACIKCNIQLCAKCFMPFHSRWLFFSRWIIVCFLVDLHFSVRKNNYCFDWSKSYIFRHPYYVIGACCTPHYLN